MSRTCILTDSSVIFTKPGYPGNEHVSILPLGIKVKEKIYPDIADPGEWQNLYPSLNPDPIFMVPPSVEDFCQAYWALGQRYHTILVILISSHLSPALQNAHAALEKAGGSAAIHIIDSQTTASGLGFLVQAAAEAIAKGLSSSRVYTLIRGMIPHIYTIFCLQNFSYLANAGKLDPEQAIISEMIGIIPFYIIESGKLIPVQKARSPRQIVAILDEFVSEFNHLHHVSVVQGNPAFDQEIKNLKERLSQKIPNLSLSEHSLGMGLLSLLGPRSLGVFVLEAND